MTLLSEAFSVAEGACPPAHPRRAYLDAAVVWATSQARPGESQDVALARLCASGSVVVGACYRAAAIASLLDDLDPDELLPEDAPDVGAYRRAWADFLKLIAPHGRPGEPLPTTLRRLLGENVAACAMYVLLLQESNQ